MYGLLQLQAFQCRKLVRQKRLNTYLQTQLQSFQGLRRFGFQGLVSKTCNLKISTRRAPCQVLDGSVSRVEMACLTLRLS